MNHATAQLAATYPEFIYFALPESASGAPTITVAIYSG
jgi:hypothetical protein